MRALGGESGQEVSETERRVDGAHLLLGRAGWQSHGSSRGCGGREDGALGSGRCQGARAGVWIAPHAALGPHTCSPRSPGGLGYPLVASSSSTSSVEGSPRRGMARDGGACIPGVRADVPASLYPRMAAPAGKEVTSVSWPAAGRQLRDGPGPTEILNYSWGAPRLASLASSERGRHPWLGIHSRGRPALHKALLGLLSSKSVSQIDVLGVGLQNRLGQRPPPAPSLALHSSLPWEPSSGSSGRTRCWAPHRPQHLLVNERLFWALADPALNMF